MPVPLIYGGSACKNCTCWSRLELALSNSCSDECEDILQHLVTVHLGSRDAAEDPGMQEVLPVMSNSSSAGADTMLKAAAFLHHRFARLLADYSKTRHLEHGTVPWFEVYLPNHVK